MIRRTLILFGLLTVSIPAFALSKSEVRTIIEEAYPGARISEIDKERYKGEKVYEVDFRHEGRNLEAVISLEGELIKVDVDD